MFLSDRQVQLSIWKVIVSFHSVAGVAGGAYIEKPKLPISKVYL